MCVFLFWFLEKRMQDLTGAKCVFLFFTGDGNNSEYCNLIVSLSRCACVSPQHLPPLEKKTKRFPRNKCVRFGRLKIFQSVLLHYPGCKHLHYFELYSYRPFFYAFHICVCMNMYAGSYGHIYV
jgi:hypothetical protein